MSHTTKIKGVTFIHDGDMKGKVEIITGRGSLVVPVDALRGFVAEIVRDEIIEEIEGATVDRILGLCRRL